ncbi:MAG: hypothetical protein WD847_08180 [Pirellulales bacterium]
MNPGFQDYEKKMEPARQRFANNPALASVLAPTTDTELLELFLLYFSSLGVRMTEPVEGWIREAAERCEAIGLADIGRSLRGHAAAESGHHLMMVADTRALVERWNSRHDHHYDADRLLSRPPSPGARHYIQVHENVIRGKTPYAQLALEYEIEMLPLRYGPPLVSQWVSRLGEEILGCLSFITEHIELDVGHTKFNSKQLEKLIERMPDSVPSLVAAGSEVLDAYGEFLADCVRLAEADHESAPATGS